MLFHTGPFLPSDQCSKASFHTKCMNKIRTHGRKNIDDGESCKESKELMRPFHIMNKEIKVDGK